MQNKLENPPFQTLEDFSTWLNKEGRPHIQNKASVLQTLVTNGTELSKMTSGKEKKNLQKVCKEMSQKGALMADMMDKRMAKANHLIEVNKVNGECSIQMNSRN